tara:strand:- start:3607 stop:4755 length:1149 start_codon:yes stop_codon:yes gene_type:complete
MTLIVENKVLKSFCNSLGKTEFITVDTEFLRDKTYWPRLCLIQIGGPGQEAAIDVLAEGLDLTPVLALMRKPELLKVFHAPRQDFEIFYRLMGELPFPVIDTQISAMVCGFGDSVGYETLVSKLIKKKIDKSMRFTDWQKRPLSKKQLNYALADVTHLRIIYQKLSQMVDNNNRENWIKEEVNALLDPTLYTFDVREAWKRLKIKNPTPRLLGIIREVAAWRENAAQSRNVPRNRIARDDVILSLAIQKPRTLNELGMVRGLNDRQKNGKTANKILAAISDGIAVPIDDCPKVLKTQKNKGKYRPTSDLLKVLLKLKCEEHSVAQKLIANSDELDELARNDGAKIRALKGWRREIFGEDALALKHGKIAVTMKNDKYRIINI